MKHKIVTFKSQPMSLVGRQVAAGYIAPKFKCVSVDLQPKGLSDFADRIKIITTFPSLDTSVCDMQVKQFNSKAADMHQDCVIVGVSKDLPFAQKRFCEANAIDKVHLLSDYHYSSFGFNYGVLVEQLNLLARTVFIVDKTDVIRYVQIVGEIADQPDYEDVLSQLKEVIARPTSPIENNVAPFCLPCEAGTPPLSSEKIQRQIPACPGWILKDDRKITKEFTLRGFEQAKCFVDAIAAVAQEQGHHPNITIIYNKVRITLTTHAAEGLTDNDFIMARIIEEIGIGGVS